MIEITHLTSGEVLESIDAQTLQAADLRETRLAEADLKGRDLHDADRV